MNLTQNQAVKQGVRAEEGISKKTLRENESGRPLGDGLLTYMSGT